MPGIGWPAFSFAIFQDFVLFGVLLWPHIQGKKPTTFVQKLEKSSFRNSNKTLRKNFQVPTKLNRKLKHRIKNATISAFQILSKSQQRDADAYTEMGSGGYILLVKNKG